MRNLYAEFRDLLAPGVLMIGDVTAYADGSATVTLLGGGTLRARGETTVGARVYVRDGLIDGPAPTLTLVNIEV